MKSTYKVLVLAAVIISGSIASAQGRGGERGPGSGRDARDREHDRIIERTAFCPAGRTGYEIELRDEEYQGRGEIIYLKKELLTKYPRLDLKNMNLQSVCLVAKSKFGRGTAELMVGQSSQDRKNIDGTPQGFDNVRERTFDEVMLNNYSRFDDVPWQIHLMGNVKIRKIVVHAVREPSGGGWRMNYKDVDGGKFDKLIYSRKTVMINQTGVEELSLVGLNKGLDIRSVIATFNNGEKKLLMELEGRLHAGQSKTAILAGRGVASIEVEATSIDLIGGRAELGVKVGYR